LKLDNKPAEGGTYMSIPPAYEALKPAPAIPTAAMIAVDPARLRGVETRSTACALRGRMVDPARLRGIETELPI